MPNSNAVQNEYRAARVVGGYWRRCGRAIVEVTGADRATWLNNLVTNVVKTLAPGEGNYAFAVDIKGRVVFDLNMLVLADRLWLDLDARWTQQAMAHLDRYVISEDVKLADLSSLSNRIAIMGPKAVDVVARLGFGNLSPMAQLQHVPSGTGDDEIRMVRCDLVGLAGAEFIAKQEGAIGRIEQLAREAGMTELSPATLEILRIEHGIPASFDDIDKDVVPPETGQIERGISYHKGCYLGQEVIERMRSHGVLARRLVGLRLDGESLAPRSSAIKLAGQDVGRVTSCCWSEAAGAPLALGYIKTAYLRPGAEFAVALPDGDRKAEIVNLPVSSDSA